MLYRRKTTRNNGWNKIRRKKNENISDWFILGTSILQQKRKKIYERGNFHSWCVMPCPKSKTEPLNGKRQSNNNILTSSLVSLVEMIFVFDIGTPSKNHATLATMSQASVESNGENIFSILMWAGWRWNASRVAFLSDERQNESKRKNNTSNENNDL